MSVDGKLDAKFGVNRTGRNLVLSESELDGTRSALGQTRKSSVSLKMSVVGDQAEVIFGRPDVSLCRVGPGNFTPSPSQNRT